MDLDKFPTTLNLDDPGDGGQPLLRLERTYRHAPERAWHNITDDGEFSHWFGVQRTISELAPGGRVEMSFQGQDPDVGEVTSVDVDGHTLAFTWQKEELRFRVLPEGDGETRVVFTTTVQDRSHLPHSAAGYFLSMEGLALKLDQAGDGDALPSFDALAEHFAQQWS